ncbi:hypothetical protein [Bradyrhizobium iriomotense]|uniref:hypothetical protein n=1 Tax=Bradyrhizobium iriomotense TaxID=441950 RepID=UPI0024E15CC8|nr:hypothetical protein [Bradyrhizobium iriomotense]
MREVMGDVTVGLSRNEFASAVFSWALAATCRATRRLRNVDDLPIPSLAKGKPHAVAGEEGVANFGQCSQRIHGVAIHASRSFVRDLSFSGFVACEQVAKLNQLLQKLVEGVNLNVLHTAAEQFQTLLLRFSLRGLPRNNDAINEALAVISGP